MNLSVTSNDAARDAQCRLGHMGIRCELCDNERGYVRKPNGPCAFCGEDEKQQTIWLVAVSPFALALVSYIIYRCMVKSTGWTTRPEMLAGLRDNFNRRASKIRILISFTQVISRLQVTFRLTFPPVVMQFLRWFNLFEFLNVFQFAFMPSCLHQLNYYEQLMGKVLMPAVILLAALVGFKATQQRWMYEFFLLLSFVCYPAFCDSLFLFFDCMLYEDGETYLGKQQFLLTRHPLIELIDSMFSRVGVVHV